MAFRQDLTQLRQRGIRSLGHQRAELFFIAAQLRAWTAARRLRSQRLAGTGQMPVFLHRLQMHLEQISDLGLAQLAALAGMHNTGTKVKRQRSGHYGVLLSSPSIAYPTTIRNPL
jgi:hypothetical protein